MTGRMVTIGLVLVTALLLATVVLPTFAVAGVRPDIVLLSVVGLALADGPATGARYGFGAGFAVDLLSGANAPVGLTALVFLLAGYGVGLARPYMTSSGLPGELATTATATAGAGLVYGLLAMTLDVGSYELAAVVWTTVGTTVYTVLVAPLVLPVLIRLSRRFSPGASLTV